MASALITVPPRRSASASASADLPLAVGPVMTMTRCSSSLLLHVGAGELFANRRCRR
jgi:hypothetical protein